MPRFPCPDTPERRPRRGLHTLAVLVVLVAAAWRPCALPAQEGADGGTANILGGAALGLFSAGYSGLVGSLFPCNRTRFGSSCAAAGAGFSGAVGLVTGGYLGSRSPAAVDVRLENAGYGLVVGAAVGFVMQGAVRQYGWADAAAIALYGGAVGAAPRGTLVGTLAGSAVGGLVVLVSSEAGLPDFLMFALIGSTVGTLYDWTDQALDARPGPSPAFVLPTVSIPFG